MMIAGGGVALDVDFAADGSMTVTHGGATLFEASDCAVFVEGAWHVSGVNLTLVTSEEDLRGADGIGSYTGVARHWALGGQDDDVIWVTTARVYASGRDVAFESRFPQGAAFGSPHASPLDARGVVAHFPAFGAVAFNETVTWAGSFVQLQRADFVGGANGVQGGPTVFFDDADVVVASPLDHFKAWSAGTGETWDGSKAWAPGLKATVRAVDGDFSQTHLLHHEAKASITAALEAWGHVLRRATKAPGTKVPDVTLEKVGYQTDNGAFYCFCDEADCSATLVAKLGELRGLGAPMGYLSFQGAGASSSSTTNGAPWCVSKWGVDGGLSPRYPGTVAALHARAGVPLQLYAPYFCPDSAYFDPNGGPWPAVRSSASIVGCSGFDFIDVAPAASRAFYDGLFRRGMDAGMRSFEPDFMNQNANCVPEFAASATATAAWQRGMADAAEARGVAIQWCYATPTDVLASVTMAAVTNFRVSFDFCYGRSWDLGASSLLVWALGAAPSKDTLWTTPNHGFEVPGCPWTRDHDRPDLHLVVALMSMGPVGISDGLGGTDARLLKKAIAVDGTLLKPSKPLTAVDATLRASPGRRRPDGQVLATYSHRIVDGRQWPAVHQVVSFSLRRPYTLTALDFHPRLDDDDDDDDDNGATTSYVSRRAASDDDASGCRDGGAARACGFLPVVDLAVTVPASDFANETAGSDLAPIITTLWPRCANGWVLVGDLDKFVPLSPLRFPRAACDDGFTARGGPNETIRVAFLTPRNVLRVVNVHFSAPNTTLRVPLHDDGDDDDDHAAAPF